MKLATNKRAVSMIIGTLIAVIIAVIFVRTVGGFIGNIINNTPTVIGAVGYPASAICFGGGDDNTVHCLEKETKRELFSFKKAKNWDGPADVTPILTERGVFFAIGNRVCAYNAEGGSMWDEECKSFSDKISDLSANKKDICFGEDEQYTCLGKEFGSISLNMPVNEAGYISIDEEFLLFTNYESTSKKEVTLQRGKSTEFNGAEIKFDRRDRDMNAAFIYVNGKEHRIANYDWYTYAGAKLKIQRITDYSLTLSLVAEDSFYSVNKYDFDNNKLWSTTSQTSPTSKIIFGKDKVCIGTEKGLMCFDKLDGKETNILPEGKITVAPAMKDDVVYYAIGSAVYEYNFTSKSYSKLVYETKGEVSTDLVLMNDVLCFGLTYSLSPKIDIGQIMCIDTSIKAVLLLDNVKLFVEAPRDWDEKEAYSKPYVSVDRVYFGLGDHVCSYNSTIGRDIDVNKANWCTDFDYIIPTGVAGFEAGVISDE